MRLARSSTRRPYRASASRDEVREQRPEQRARAGERELDPAPLDEHAEARIADGRRRQEGEREQDDREPAGGEEEEPLDAGAARRLRELRSEHVPGGRAQPG